MACLAFERNGVVTEDTKAEMWRVLGLAEKLSRELLAEHLKDGLLEATRVVFGFAHVLEVCVDWLVAHREGTYRKGGLQVQGPADQDILAWHGCKVFMQEPGTQIAIGLAFVVTYVAIAVLRRAFLYFERLLLAGAKRFCSWICRCFLRSVRPIEYSPRAPELVSLFCSNIMSAECGVCRIGQKDP